MMRQFIGMGWEMQRYIARVPPAVYGTVCRLLRDGGLYANYGGKTSQRDEERKQHRYCRPAYGLSKIMWHFFPPAGSLVPRSISAQSYIAPTACLLSLRSATGRAALVSWAACE